MRRLVSYIVMSAAILIGVGCSIAPNIERMNSDAAYSDGQKLTFRIGEKNEEGRSFYDPINDEVNPFTDDTAVTAIADTMAKRLEKWGISEYDVSMVGYDTVTVTVKPFYNDTTEYTRLAKYLSFSGGDFSLSASIIKDEDYPSSTDLDSMFDGQSASVQYIENNAGGSSYPVCVIPVRHDGTYIQSFRDLIKYCNDNTKAEDSENKTPAVNCNLILWANRQEGDISELNEDKSVRTSDENVASRIILQEATGSDNAIWYASNDDDASDPKQHQYPYLRLVPTTTNNGSASDSYREATYFEKMLNASTLDYQVDFLYRTDAKATVEKLVTTGDWYRSPATGRTLISVIATFAVMAVLLAVFQRVLSLASISVTALSTFLTFLFFVNFGIQFNVAALVGLLAVAALTVFGQIFYQAKLKDELYRGRTLKKAHQEAAKKSLWPTLDASIVSIILGIFLYIFAGDIASKLGVMLSVGGVVAAFLNLILFRLMTYILSLDNTMQEAFPKAIGVRKESIPDPVKSEKQTYFGAYAGKNFTKHWKWVAPLGAALAVAGIAASVFFGIRNGTPYNDPTIGQETTCLYIEARTRGFASNESAENNTDFDSIDVIYKSYTQSADGTYDYTTTANREASRSLLRNIYYRSSESAEFTPLYMLYNNGDEDLIFSSINQVSTPLAVYDSSLQLHYYWYYFTVDMPRYFPSIDETSSSANLFGVSLDGEVGADGTKTPTDLFTNLSDALDDYMVSYYQESMVSSSNTPIIAAAKNTASKQIAVPLSSLALSVGVGIAVALLYFMLRYGFSRGIAVSVLALFLGFDAIAPAIFTRLAVTPIVALGAVVAVLLFYLAAIYVLAKAKDIYKNSRERDKQALAFRLSCLEQANGQAAGETFLFLLLSASMALTMGLIGPAVYASPYVDLIFGAGLSCLFVIALLTPLSNVINRLLDKIKIKPRHKKEKTGRLQKKGSKSAEPEEAIFIGIND